MKSEPSSSRQLSPQGERRRTHILDAMLSEADRIHRSRRLRRRIGFSLMLIVAGGTMVHFLGWPLPPPSEPTTSELAQRVDSVDSVDRSRRAVISVFESSGQDRSAHIVLTSVERSRVAVVDDAQLLDDLASLDQAAGIWRSGDEAHLLLAARGD